jgi:hypothetical protein
MQIYSLRLNRMEPSARILFPIDFITPKCKLFVDGFFKLPVDRRLSGDEDTSLIIVLHPIIVHELDFSRKLRWTSCCA